jgi:hypothetical protein
VAHVHLNQIRHMFHGSALVLLEAGKVALPRKQNESGEKIWPNRAHRFGLIFPTRVMETVKSIRSVSDMLTVNVCARMRG